MSAWIEIVKSAAKVCLSKCRTLCECVDWNIRQAHVNHWLFMSHSLWVRGLKLVNTCNYIVWTVSHSLWVRGLKLHFIRSFRIKNNVALFVSAWIEIEKERWEINKPAGRTLCECVDWNELKECKKNSSITSHSLWVRGLKCTAMSTIASANVVALFVSAWIEINYDSVPYWQGTGVALFVSAWIEIRHKPMAWRGSSGRTLCECVDWNSENGILP